MSRKPSVAGTFYSEDATQLDHDIQRCFLSELGPRKLPITQKHQKQNSRLLGMVVPHAGYVYSGPAAAYGYNALADEGLPEIAVILGPNHHGMGKPVSVASDAEWLTPLGTALVDAEASEAITKASNYAQRDDSAHVKEHAIEVQLPFIQFIGGHKVKIVPISIAHLLLEDSISVMYDLGHAIAGVLNGKSSIVIASTDFSHYEDQQTTLFKDQLAIDCILALDPERLIRTVSKHDISMCGVVGTAVMLSACKELGATSARILTHYTSGDVGGDRHHVVGYAAIALEK